MNCPRCGAVVPADGYRCDSCSTYLRNPSENERTLQVDAASSPAYYPPPITQMGRTTHALLLTGTPLAEDDRPDAYPPPNYAQAPIPTLPSNHAMPGQAMPAATPTVAYSQPPPAIRRERMRRDTLNTGAIVAFCVTLLLTVSGIFWFVYSHRPRNYILTDKMRLLRVGDEFRYKVTMQMSMPPELDVLGRGSRPLTGFYNVKIQSMRLGDRNMPAETTHSSLNGLDLSEGSLTYFEQDPSTRETVKLADVHGARQPFRRVVEHEGGEPGVYSEHLTGRHRYVYDNGDTEEEVFRVVGAEPVQTSLGRFMAWRVEETDTMTGEDITPLMPNQIDSTVWIVPQLGREVKATATVQSKLLPSTTITMTLDSTNVPLF